jgi:hypothetical protein
MLSLQESREDLGEARPFTTGSVTEVSLAIGDPRQAGRVVTEAEFVRAEESAYNRNRRRRA